MAWAHVANDKTGNGSVIANTFDASWTANLVVGNRAFIVFNANNGNNQEPICTGITDPRGNTWTRLSKSSIVDTSNISKGTLEVWTAQIVTQILSTDALTVNFPVAGYNTFSWSTHEYSGLDPGSSPVDRQVSVNSGAGSTAVDSGLTAATRGANELVLRVYGDSNLSPAWSVAPAGTVRANSLGSIGEDVWVSDADSGAIGSTFATTGTLTSGQFWSAQVIIVGLPPPPVAGKQFGWAALTSGG